MDNIENLLQDTLQNDKLNTKPSNEVYSRLHNQMLAQAATRQIRKNSLIPLSSNVSAKKYLILKIGIAAVFVISFFGIKQINRPGNYIQIADSTNMHPNIDTLSFQLADSNINY